MNILNNKKNKKENLHITEYLSFSGVKDWDFCPHYYKLTRIDKLYKFEGNIHTAFGKAVHSSLELLISKKNHKDIEYVVKEVESQFISIFHSEAESVGVDTESKDFKDMVKQGESLFPHVIPFMKARFGNYELVSIEESLDEPIEGQEESEIKYKGFVDLVIKTSDGKFHIIDWKTCSWGWNWQKKTDPMTTYQLTYYKNFFAKKYGIDLKKIETYFILLKRTAKKNIVEAIRVSSGQKKTGNALKLLNTAIHNIENGNHIKKKTSCRSCSLWRNLCEG